jgi:hypothetical protein
VSDAEKNRCRHCTAEIDLNCRCEDCKLLTLGQLRGIGFCHVCMGMYKAVGARPYWMQLQQEWIKAQRRIRGLLEGRRDRPEGK